MKNYFSLVLALLVLFAVQSTRTANAEVGDTQILMAFNAGYHEVVASGEYDTILEKWGVGGFEYDQCSPESSPLNEWPENPEGLFQTILIQSKPFWNGSAGLEDDLARAVTRRIGAHYSVPDLTFRWVSPVISPNGYFESLYKNLESLGSDIILSYMGITPNRQQFVDFTCPYFYVYHSVVRTGLDPEKTLTTIEQLNTPGVKVVIVKGSYYEQIAATNLTRATVYIRDTMKDLFTMLADEQVHAGLTAEIYVVGAQPTFTSLSGNTLHNVTIHRFGQPGPMGACVRKETSDQESSSASSVSNKSIVLLAAAAAVVVVVVLVSASQFIILVA